MRFLFVKQTISWPRSSGHDVHSYYMMRALSQLGHEIFLLTETPPRDEAVVGIEQSRRSLFSEWEGDSSADYDDSMTRLQKKFSSYWGIEPRRIAGVGRASQELNVDVLVVVGLEVLPYLCGPQKCVRIWYAADEWAWHHWSQVRWSDTGSWSNLKDAAIKGLYEFAFRNVMDRVWVVSEADRRAMRLATGVKGIDVAPNGIDADHYQPRRVVSIPASCVFWGRLDFGPNVDALLWFLDKVWPLVRRQSPEARFDIFGFQPTPAIATRAGREGVTVTPDVPDLRDDIARRQLVVLPFVSGGGIKNKLLEAAAMGKAIIGSRSALNGVDLDEPAPIIKARTPREWVEQIIDLWSNDEYRNELGKRARQWVISKHSWESAARTVLAPLSSPGR